MVLPYPISLRDATGTDAPLLRHWDQQAHVREATNADEDWEWEQELSRKPPWRQQLIAMLDDRPLGFVQIIDPYEEETHYWGHVEPNLRAIDVWLGNSADRRKGYGTSIMRLAFQRCFASAQVQGILIDPFLTNEAAHRFYETLGFKKLGPRELEGDLCLVYRLDRTDWKKHWPEDGD
ncbi:MAG: GNAT family N-acetyltransferase [Bacteroidota bacterium]